MSGRKTTNNALAGASYRSKRPQGFTLAEFIIAIMMVSLFVSFASWNLTGLFSRNTFKAQVQELVSTLQMAANGAAESNRKYEVLVDLDNQSYVLREITSSDLSEVRQEEVIVKDFLTENCWISYVIFDDGDYTNQGMAKFRCSNSGWQYGGKIVLLDENDQAFSIIVNRLNRDIDLKRGDTIFLTPKREDEIIF